MLKRLSLIGQLILQSCDYSSRNGSIVVIVVIVPTERLLAAATSLATASRVENTCPSVINGCKRLRKQNSNQEL